MESSPDATLATSVVTPRADLAGRARLAIAWATGLQFFRDVVQLGLTLILVRLLPAEAYGQFGFLTTLLTVFTYYSFREFLNYTMQLRDGEPVHYQDHFTAGAVIQLGMVVVVNAVALAFRWMPAYAPVSTVLHVMSLLFLIDLPAEFRTKMLERDLNWKRLRLLQATGFVAGGALSLLMVLAGFGVWGLIVPTLLVPVPFIFDLFVTERWRPTWQFDWARFQPAWRFGISRLITVTFVASAMLVESLSLASILGFSMLGIFGRATGLSHLLCGRIGSLLSIAIYPVLTRMPRASDGFRRAGALYLRGVAWTVVPAAVAASMFADVIVRTLYGKTWLAAVPLLPWALCAAGLGALVQTAYTVLLANGQQRACVIADAWRFGGTVLALVLILPLGSASYLGGMAVVQLAALGIVATFLVRHHALHLDAIRTAIWPAVASTAAAVLCVFGVRAFVGEPDATAPAVAGQATLFVCVYGCTLRFGFAGAVREFVGYLPQSTRLVAALGLAGR